MQRKSAITRPLASSVTVASHTWVVRPRCWAVALHAIAPSRTVPRWLLLSSMVVKESAPAGRWAMVAYRGVNISSEQIDEEIMRYPAVLECGTIGVPSALGEEDIHTCIVWRELPKDEDAAIEDLMRFLVDRLPRQYVPRYIEPVESLPRTGNGKVRKVELSNRAIYGRRFDREAGAWFDREQRER